MRPTLPQRALLVKLFYTRQCNAVAALREFRRLHNLRKGPLSAVALRAMIKKFEETGSLGLRAGRGRKAVPDDAVTDVATAVFDDTGTSSGPSARAIARQTDMPYATVWKILRKTLHFYPYKISRVQALHITDPDKRLTFALTFLARMEIDNDWPWNILWGDEAHFYLNGSVNTQNCRIWACERPTVIQEVPLHSPKVTVWCGFTATFILGPYFFEHITRTGPMTCTVTGEKYGQMLQTFVIPQLQQRQCLDSIIFMQDGARPHIHRSVQRLLRQHFGSERVISQYFPTEWPPRSPDITPCDFWLWGYLKSVVYAGGVPNLHVLKQNIRRAITNIQTDSLHAAVENVVHRMHYVVHRDGQHIENVARRPGDPHVDE